ncbi:AraC family transcriptional regulator [uncultured Desulfobacter sp.]|uniref:helix-turn-helix domain-containing protein n=2 Tax=Desulfobacter TaxID=2289 RepID=UPI00035EA554|nr:AraC family transcriptional regulator [uncultured Desulfobacter sp.]
MANPPNKKGNASASYSENQEIITLTSGISLIITDFLPQSDTLINMDIDGSYVSFGFTLSVQAVSNLKTESGKKVEIYHTCQGTEVSFIPKTRAKSKIWAGIPFRSVCLTMPPSLLAFFITGQEQSFPDSIQRISGEEKCKHVQTIGTMTPEMNYIVLKIMECSLPDPIRQIYLEAKAMELLACRLKLMMKPRPLSGIQPCDIKAVHQAAGLLTENLSHPPDMEELSRSVGLNRTKLKQGFKAVYGKSAFQYLKQFRFERVADLLTNGSMSVCEAAEAVGYNDIKHFYQNFRNHFGTTPGTFRKTI